MAKAISTRSNQISEREQVKYDIFHLLCERGIQTPQELDFFFREYLELNLPKKRVCSNHLSPFEIICDIFFKQPPMSLWISSRGSGKTRTLANLDTIMLLTKPDFNIIHSAAIQAQTNQAYNYFLASHKYKGIKDMVEGDPTRDKTRFINQSQISLITMTYQGTNCVTGDTLIECPRNIKKLPHGIRIDLLEKYFSYSKKHKSKKPKIFAYAFDEHKQKFTIKRIKDVFVTGTKDVWELKYKVRDLDDRRKFTTGALRATPDHPIYVRGKGWTRLDALKPEDSLKAMGRKNLDYPFLVMSDEGYVPEHRFIGREHFGYDSNKEVIHHKDFNKYNNSLKNLERLTVQEHVQLHSVEQRTIIEKEYLIELLQKHKNRIKRVAKELGVDFGTVKRNMNDYGLERGDPYLNAKQYMSKKEYREYKIKLGNGSKKTWDNLSDKKYKDVCKQRSENWKLYWSSMSAEERSERNKKAWANISDEKRIEWRKSISDAAKGTRSGKDNGMYGKRHSSETKKKISIAMQGNNSWKNRKGSLLYNHTVISVSPLGKKEKVYDMEVEGSFVANGIVVHNSPH